MLTYNLDRDGETSLYEQLYCFIRADIEKGVIAPGQKLPSKRSLSAHLGVSVITVEGALSQLVAEGYVQARPRSGYFACALPPTVKKKALVTSAAPSGAPAPSAPAPIADFTALGPADPGAFDRWMRTLRRVAAREDAARLSAPLPPQGSLRLRRAIAGHLAGSRAMAADPDCIVIGAGSQVLYGLLVQLLGRGAPFAVEDPGYPALAQIYRAQGAVVAPLPLDAQGVSMEALRASRAAVVHVMPSHQYPCGLVTSAARRRELLAWANGRPGRWVIEDDYDCEFRMAGRPVPALAGVDGERVIYLNTFARSLSPTLRMAYMVLPPALARQFERKLGFYANTVSSLAQVALATLIESGAYERGVNRQRTAHRVQRDRLAQALRRAGGDGRAWLEEADSGLHCLLALRSQRSEAEISQAVRRRGVAVRPLSCFCQDLENYRAFCQAWNDAAGMGEGGAPVRRFLLNYGAIEPAHLQPALEIILDEAEGRCHGASLHAPKGRT